MRFSPKTRPTSPSPGSSTTLSRSSRRKPRPERGTSRPVVSSRTNRTARSAASSRETRSIARPNSSPGGSPSGGTDRISWKMSRACASRSGWRSWPDSSPRRSRRLSRTSPSWESAARTESSLIAGLAGSLPGERADVSDEGPAVVLGEVPPRGHGSPPGGDLPEDLPVRLVLHPLRRPVRRLGVQRDGGGPIALPQGAVARHAVDLGDLLALLDRLLVGGQRILLRLLGVGCDPRPRLGGHLDRAAARGEDQHDHDQGESTGTSSERQRRHRGASCGSGNLKRIVPSTLTKRTLI